MGVFEQFPYTNFHDLNLDWILQKIKELQTELEALTPASVILKEYEKSANITNARKLSALGNFTGTLNGVAISTMLNKINSNADALKYLSDQFSDGQTGLVIDGAFFEDDGIHKNYNGGVF